MVPVPFSCALKESCERKRSAISSMSALGSPLGVNGPDDEGDASADSAGVAAAEFAAGVSLFVAVSVNLEQPKTAASSINKGIKCCLFIGILQLFFCRGRWRIYLRIFMNFLRKMAQR